MTAHGADGFCAGCGGAGCVECDGTGSGSTSAFDVAAALVHPRVLKRLVLDAEFRGYAKGFDEGLDDGMNK